jgi:predicted TIM-barrel fold metal-dependent hydrolase
MAGGNLSRLLGGWSPIAAGGGSSWRDAFTQDAIAGRPLSPLVIDAHCHVGHDDCTSLAPDIATPGGDASGMIELTRRTGIDRTAVMSWAGPLCMESERGNAIVADAVRRYPREMLGVATINPEYDSPADIDRAIQTYHAELGFPGIKTFSPNQTIDYDDPLFTRWLTYANDHALYLVFDPKGGVTATDVLTNVAQRFPRLRVHLDHCGQSWQYAKWAVEMLHRLPNVYAQLNYTMVTNGVVEYLAGAVSAGRLLFGTDAPMRDPRPQVGWLVFTRMTEAQKRLVFGLNFQRQLGECYPQGR